MAVKEMTATTGIRHRPVQEVVESSGYRKGFACWVPRLLTEEPKFLAQKYFLTIAGRTWRQLISQHLRPTCAFITLIQERMERRHTVQKTMVTAFWNAEWCSLLEFLPQGETSKMIFTFRRFKNFVVHCMPKVKRRKTSTCHTTRHGPTPLICARKGFKYWLETSPPSTTQSGPRSIGIPPDWVRKRWDARTALRDHWDSPGSRPALFINCWNGFFHLMNQSIILNLLI
jgi:hypothetical protein